MKRLKNLGAAVALTLAFGVPAFADCSYDPGILSTPPVLLLIRSRLMTL